MARKRKKSRKGGVCATERAAIGKAGGRKARGKALARFMKCRAAHGIKPRRHRRRRRK